MNQWIDLLEIYYCNEGTLYFWDRVEVPFKFIAGKYVMNLKIYFSYD